MKRSKGRRRHTVKAGLSLHTKGLLLWTAALATGILCVWEHIYSARLAVEIADLEERRESLLAEIGFLEVRCTALSARERIETYAFDRLGMRYPRAGEVVRLRGHSRRETRGSGESYVLGGM